MTAKVVSANPAMDQQGSQRFFDTQNGRLWKYWYILSDGTQGEVSHKEQKARFNPGDEVEYTVTTKNPQYPTLKIEKVGGFQQGGGKGFSPEKQAQIEVQGLVQAAIASGAKDAASIEGLVKLGMTETARITKMVLAHRQAQQPAAPAQNPNPVQYRQDAPPVGNFPAGPQYQQPAPQRGPGGSGAFPHLEGQDQAPF